MFAFLFLRYRTITASHSVESEHSSSSSSATAFYFFLDCSLIRSIFHLRPSQQHCARAQIIINIHISHPLIKSCRCAQFTASFFRLCFALACLACFAAIGTARGKGKWNDMEIKYLLSSGGDGLRSKCDNDKKAPARSSQQTRGVVWQRATAARRKSANRIQNTHIKSIRRTNEIKGTTTINIWQV